MKEKLEILTQSVQEKACTSVNSLKACQSLEEQSENAKGINWSNWDKLIKITGNTFDLKNLELSEAQPPAKKPTGGPSVQEGLLPVSTAAPLTLGNSQVVPQLCTALTNKMDTSGHLKKKKKKELSVITISEQSLEAVKIQTKNEGQRR